MKRTKKITQTLKAIASMLPKRECIYYDTRSEDGDDLIKRGITEDADKKPILPQKKYLRKVPVKAGVNHVNRLKSAWDAGGLERVKAYIKPLLKPDMEKEFFNRLDTALA